MPSRRNKDADWIGSVAQLAGVLILLSLISPQIRQTVSAFGLIACWLVGLAVAGLTGFGVYRRATRAQRATSSESFTSITYVPPVSLSRREVPLEPAVPHTTADLLERLRSIDWFQFEKLVGLAYLKLGYAVTRRGGANPDGGIDLVIEKDGERFAVQCKQWKTWSVGVKAMREFLGALRDAGIQKGVFITLCGYTGEANRLADKHGIKIVSEAGLAEMLESSNARFDPEALAILSDTRKFCPKCENAMVVRMATKGTGVGKQFWGCSQYPKCRFTMPVL